MRLGKGPASPIGIPSEGPLVVTLSAEMGLHGVGEIIGFSARGYRCIGQGA